MKRASRENPEIREFILNNIEQYPDTMSSLVVKKFGVSRSAVSGYMSRLIDAGLIVAEGTTRARHYKLKKLVDITFNIELFDGLPEDLTWIYKILPNIKDERKNVVDICQYGFTEILNNAVDHSVSKDAKISYGKTYNEITMLIQDYGVGIFRKIQDDFNLPDPRAALLELSKGRLTSSPSRHAGEGIFFTSRMFDTFAIFSGNLLYRKTKQDDGWLVEIEDQEKYVKGTIVLMIISTNATWTTKEIFNQFQGDNLRFRKTHVPIKLAGYPGEQLVSRSQAKRVLARFENFSEVLLDFESVDTIGQAFADEIFRVFNNYHPETKVIAINTSPDIDQMIAYVKNASPKVPNDI